MSLKHRNRDQSGGLIQMKQEAQKRVQQERIAAAGTLHAPIEELLTRAKTEGVLAFSPHETFYPDLDSDSEANAHEYRTTLRTQGKEFKLIDRVFDDPRTGEARLSLVINGDELPVEGGGEMFGIIMYLDAQKGAVEDIEARTFDASGEMVDIPAAAIDEMGFYLRRVVDSATFELS